MMLVGWMACLAAGWFAVRAVRRVASRSIASPWRRGLARLAADRPAMAALFVLAALATMAVLAPLVAPYAPNAQPDPVQLKDLPPSIAHLFGTDFASRDVFSRVLYGSRISLSVAALAVLLSTVVGTAYGALSGFYGGRLDGLMMRLLDAALAIPRILLVMAVVALVDSVTVPTLVLLLGFTGWFGTSRLVRAQVLTLREQDLTTAARALGARDREILWRHLLPNIVSTVIVAATLSLGNVIILEASLSYLGVGIRPPTPSWGNIIEEGSSALGTVWWMALFPGIAIVADRARDQHPRRRAARRPRPAHGGRPVTAPLLEVSELRTVFRAEGRVARAVDGVSLHHRAGGDRRPRRRVGVREVGDRALDHAPHPRAGRDRGGQPDHLRIERPGDARRPRDAGDPRRAHRDGLPGADDVAQSRAHRRRAGRGGGAGARRRVEARTRGRARSRRSKRWASPIPPPARTTTRTSSPAACGSA